MLRRTLISLFCVLNVTAVLVANQPDTFRDAKSTWLASNLSAHNAFRARYGEWLVMRYAHLAGLDNKWKMFSTLHRFDWWYVIKARFADGREEVLPLPRQSERSWWQRAFVDFKEAKFHLNIYLREDYKRAYGRYLCRETEDRTGEAPVFIIYELDHRMLKERPEAVRLGTHQDDVVGKQVYQVVDCAWTRQRRGRSL